MKSHRRTTIHLDPDLHRALRVKAADTDRSMSDLVNQAVRRDLEEDAVDFAAYRKRKKETGVVLGTALAAIKRRGKL